MRAWQVALALFLFLTGMAGVAQWRTERPLRARTQLPSRRVQEVAVLLKRQEEAVSALEAEIQRLQGRLGAYLQAIQEGRGAAEALAQELAQLRMALGLLPVEGPGVVVRLDRPALGGGPLPVTIRAADLAGLVNELWAAGAEAVAVNGVRILATTGVRDRADGAIVVGTAPMVPPFTVAAIGEPLTLHGALSLRGGFVDGLQAIGLRVTVQRQARLRLPPYRGPLLFRHARPESR